MPSNLSSAIHRFSFSNLTSLQLFQLIRYGTFILIGVGFAKLQLPLSEIGNFETFLMITGMVSYFWVSGIINTMLSVYPKKSEQEKKELLFSTFLSLVLLSFIAGIILLTFSESILSFLEKDYEMNIAGLGTIYLLLSAPSFIIEYVLFLNERKKAIVYYAIASSILTLVAALLPVILSYGIVYSLYGMIAVAVCKFIVTLFVMNRFASFVFDWQMQVANIKRSLPLLISIFVSGSSEYIDGMIVKWKFDNVSFAVFRYGAKELPLLLIVANTFSTAMIPAIADSLDKGLAEIKSKSAQLMHLFFPLTIVLMLCSGYIYRLAFSESFVYSALIFNFYLLLIIPRLVFPQTILAGIQQTKFLLVSSVIEITINVLLSIWLADKIGLPGIALGTLIAFCFDKIFLVSVSYFIFKIKPSSYLQTGLFCIYSAATCIAFAFGYYLLLHLS